jgi:hypothetical protein
MIIGIAGAKRAGKNTVAQIIEEAYGDTHLVKQWSFAEDLKKSAAAALGYFDDSTVSAVEFCDALKENGRIIIEDLDGTGEWQISGREYLQYYGTEAHRDIFGTAFWINHLFAKIQTHGHESGTAIEERIDLITDVRFPNEADAVSAQPLGKVIRVRRKEVEGSGDSHASETPLPKPMIDREVWNNSSIKELERNVRGVMTWLLKQEK